MKTSEIVGICIFLCIPFSMVSYLIYDLNWPETTEYNVLRMYEEHHPHLKTLITEAKKDGYVSKYELNCIRWANNRIEFAKDKAAVFPNKE